ncbi:CHAD domain-containing protein [Cobetia sp. L2A1]|uniref:CHAD domain-containing protein n=1 Tax=Cobetia sp. L2A1 TaxID=2686360 RepID=UPI00131DDC21|nr:CHAD domain-containing protein [Cobetia sp. L2A1]
MVDSSIPGEPVPGSSATEHAADRGDSAENVSGERHGQASPEDLLAGVITARLKRMQARLEQPVLSAEDIHALRVDCKYLRGGWQLRRASLGKAEVSEQQMRPRDIARALAGPREAQMLRKTHTRAYGWVDVHSQRLLDALRPGLTAAMLGEPMTELEHAPLLRLLSHEQAAWRESPLTYAELEMGLVFSRERIATLATQVVKTREVEASHRLRKWIKYRMFQLELVSAAFGDATLAELEVPTRGRRREHELLDKAASRLGNQHDFAELAQWVGERVLSRESEVHLVKAVMALAEQRLVQALKPLEKAGYA